MIDSSWQLVSASRKVGYMKKGLTCAMCGKQHYRKTTTFIDWYQRKGEEPILYYDLPYPTGQLCRQCADRVDIIMINNGRAYQAKEKE